MKAKNLAIAAALGTTALGPSLLDVNTVSAQSTTSGAISGTVADQKSGEPLAGVTVTVQSPALGSVQTAITDEHGAYKITELPPGEYQVTFYYLEITIQRAGISVGVNRVTPVYQKLNQDKAGGEVVTIRDSAPTIDPTSTTQGITIDKNYMKNIPVPGRTFESALGAAAGSANDGAGISFSGSSSLENQYIVDGVNTTSLTIGTVGSPVINDFIEEIEVITGGYNAEFGRATGGVVNVVTKSGSNEFKGSIFGTFQPGFATYNAETTPVNASSLDAVRDNAYIADIGFELGGPIIKDKLWFFVGFAPQFTADNITRTTKRQTDCRKLEQSGPNAGQLSACDPRPQNMGGNADGVPDTDPATGFFITQDLDSEVRQSISRTYNVLGKINYALNPENQGQLSIQALPYHAESPGINGPESSGAISNQLTTDLSFKWTSKFNDNKTEVEAVVGWHRDHIDSDAYTPQLANEPLQALTRGDLGVWGKGFGSETMATLNGCKNGPGSDFPLLLRTCPMDTRFYVVGGPGSLQNDTEQRQSARLALTQRVKAAGSHEFKAGIDAENNISDKVRAYSGGAFIQNFVGGGTPFVIVDRWVQLLGLPGSQAVMNNTDPRFDNKCRNGDTGDEFQCDFLAGQVGAPGTQITGNTFNWAAYVRDSWQIQPNLTLNAGVRYEEQRMRYASFLQDKTDPLTEETLGKNAMTLTGMFAPRIGLLYDWTKEGRSKAYAHWGRFYESIPMDINDRSFGGEVTYRQYFVANPAVCGNVDPKIGSQNGVGCLSNPNAVGDLEQLIGASGVLVAPGIKAQYMDEIIAGFEYEVLDDLKVGVSYQNRKLGRVIEDVSTDGANTYLIANPGEWDKSDEDALAKRAQQADATCMSEGVSSPACALRDRLNRNLTLFQGIRQFDKPRRDYNALQFTLTRRFSKKLYVQGSYTYSRIEGNYPGLISYDNGQIDPNISSQYDLIELLANRIGPLPQDRPHSIKLDGYYQFDFKKQGQLTVGARLRAFSGIPENALAAHYLYGPNESFLLPRGELGRTDFEHGLDMHVGYGRNLRKNMNLEIYFDLYNIYNHQGTFNVDNTYAPSARLNGTAGAGAPQNANPVSGGTYEDLIWVKTIDRDGNETSQPIGTNPNFHNTASRYAPGYARIGMRLTF